jgi:hypothetical protein
VQTHEYLSSASRDRFPPAVKTNMASAYADESEDDDFFPDGASNFGSDIDLSASDFSEPEAQPGEDNTRGETPMETEESASDSDSDGEANPEITRQSWTTPAQANAIPPMPNFTLEVGPTTVLTSDKSELDFFFMFFTDDVFVLLSTQTNAYAAQQIATKPDTKWQETSPDEMKTFVGLQVLRPTVMCTYTVIFLGEIYRRI